MLVSLFVVLDPQHAFCRRPYIEQMVHESLLEDLLYGDEKRDGVQPKCHVWRDVCLGC